MHNRLAEKAVTQHHGEVVKYLGDGVMGIFREPDCRQHAISAGLDIIEGMAKENETRGLRFPSDLNTKVGIYHGPIWLFKFPQATVDDPQGSTVDLAYRLCSIAGPNQLVCAEDVFARAGGERAFPNFSDPEQRIVKGFDELLSIRILAPAGWGKPRLPLFVAPEGIATIISAMLQRAREALARKDYVEALRAFREVVAARKANFEANLRVGELLIHHGGNRDRLSDVRDAIKHLCYAKLIRPESPRVWLLLGWAHYELCDLTGDHAELERATERAEAAHELALAYMDLHGAVQAKILLAKILLAQVTSTTGPDDRKAELLSRAASLCRESADFNPVFERNRSDGLSTLALVRLAMGDTDHNSIEQMIKEAEKVDSKNPLVHEAKARLLRAPRHGRDGAGPFGYI